LASAQEKDAKGGDEGKKAQGGQGGPPPARVVVSTLTGGMVAPEAEFIGTVFYDEVSDVASEITGRVESVSFDEGQRVRKGQKLVKLDAELLKRGLESTRATHQQVRNSLEKARIDFKRNEQLYEEKLLSDKEYDEYRFAVLVLEKQAASLKADVRRIEAELKKKSITAPFAGVVVKRHVDRGEWLSEGATVATVAKDDLLEVVVNVPEKIVSFIKKGMKVTVRAGGKDNHAKVLAVIQRGDVSTRTFPVKITLKNGLSLFEGMEARVMLPSGEKVKTLMVNRDAVLTMFGRTVVFAAVEGKAVMIPVEVVGYEGFKAGIKGQGLADGMALVIKGNERLREGQPLIVDKEGAR
jgi:RND family efflux transporter MFP subunit